MMTFPFLILSPLSTAPSPRGERLEGKKRKEKKNKNSGDKPSHSWGFGWIPLLQLMESRDSHKDSGANSNSSGGSEGGNCRASPLHEYSYAKPVPESSSRYLTLLTSGQHLGSSHDHIPEEMATTPVDHGKNHQQGTTPPERAASLPTPPTALTGAWSWWETLQ